MNKDRIAFIEKNAELIRTNAYDWQSELNEFIDAQVTQANDFYARLILLPDGKKRFKKITGASDAYTEKFLRITQKRLKH